MVSAMQLKQTKVLGEFMSPTIYTSDVNTFMREADFNALVGEIDEVLEENAKEFVKNYVQKNGE